MCKICELVNNEKIMHNQVWIPDSMFSMSKVGDDYFLGVYQDHPVLKEQKIKINFCPFCGGYLADNQ